MKTKAQSDERLWTTHFVKLLAVSFLVSISYQMQTTIIPLYTQSVGGSGTVAGLTMTIFTASALAFRPLMGNWCDRKGRRTVLLLGVVLFSAVTIAYDIGKLIWALLVLRFLHGAGFSAFTTSGSTITADVVPGSRIMEGIGYYGTSATLATTIGPALGLYIIYHSGFSVMFCTAFAISLLGLLIAISINYEVKKEYSEDSISPQGLQAERQRNPNLKKVTTNLIEKTALLPSSVMLFVAIAQISVIIFLPSYALTKGIENVGLFFTIQAVAMMFTRPTIGRLSDRVGAAQVVLPGLSILLLSFVLMFAAFNSKIYLVIGALNGLGYGTVQPVLSGITVKLCPPDRKGAANSTFYSSIDLGFALGSLLYGVGSQHLGFTAVYIAAAGSAAVALLIFLIIMNKQLKKDLHKNACQGRE